MKQAVQSLGGVVGDRLGDTATSRTQRSFTGASFLSFTSLRSTNTNNTIVQNAGASLTYTPPEQLNLTPITIQPSLVHFGRLDDLYTSRFVYRITKKGHRHKRVVLVTKTDLYMVDPRGIARRRVRIADIVSGWTCVESGEVSFDVKDPHINPSFYFEDLRDVLANGGMPTVLDTVLSLAQTKIVILKTRSQSELRSRVNFKKGEGFVTVRQQLQKINPNTKYAPSLETDSNVSSGVDYDLEAMKSRLDSLAEDNDRLRQDLYTSIRQDHSVPTTPFDRTRSAPAPPTPTPPPRINVSRELPPTPPTPQPAQKVPSVMMPGSPRYMMLPIREGEGEGVEVDNEVLEAEERRLRAEVEHLRSTRPSQRRVALRQEADALRASMDGMLQIVSRCQERNSEIACTLLSAIVQTSPVRGAKGDSIRQLMETYDEKGLVEAETTRLVQEVLDRA